MTDAEYRGYAKEDGEHIDNPTHEGVNYWRYFVNEIYYMEDGNSEREPYSIIVHVKEKADGHFVYSYEAVNEKRTSANPSLYGRGVTLTNAESSSKENIAQEGSESNTDHKKTWSLKEGRTISEEVIGAHSGQLDAKIEAREDNKLAGYIEYSVYSYTIRHFQPIVWHRVTDIAVITSAHGRTKEQIQYLINNSRILYIDPDKKRTDSWLASLRVQFPSDVTEYGSINKITYADEVFNTKSKDTKIADALRKAKEKKKKDNENKEKQMSLRERDEEYMKAVRSGNMREAQRMVDEAAKKAGWRTVHAFQLYYTAFSAHSMASLRHQ